MADYNIIEINTDKMHAPAVGQGQWENRACVYDSMRETNAPLVSIVVQAYNQLEKTKYCLECILKYTVDVDYELILVDNGSTDGVLDFFKTVDYQKKIILHFTKNLGASYPFEIIRKVYKGKYLVMIATDTYVTKNWLSNLVRCLESEQMIGMVTPMCSNTSNLQAPSDFNYGSMEEMQEKAAEFNVPDSSKWQERMRLITIASVYRREIFDEVGSFDYGYEHNFLDDDISFRIRRAGYKIILCGDTFVCHDHEYVVNSQREMEKFQQALEEDRKSFREKFHGIDAWDDVNNFESNLLSYIKPARYQMCSQINVLGVDVRCGTPIMEIRNLFRKAKINSDIYLLAFTTQAKYYEDLLTTAEDVYCDRIDFIQDYIANDSVDIILLGEPINNYHKPVSLLQKMFDLLKENGSMFFKLKNMDDFSSFLRMIGLNVSSDGEMSARILPDEIKECMSLFGAKEIKCVSEINQMSENNMNLLKKVSPIDTNSQQFQSMINQFQTGQYLFYVTK